MIEVLTVPEKTENKETSEFIQKLVEDRNNSIAKRFNEEPRDVKVKLFRSKGALVASLGPNGEEMGVFSGYADGADWIALMHPENVEQIFGENLNKEISILVDNCLTKFYLCQKYFPERTDFKMYYKYVSDALAQISAGNFKESIVKFDIKSYFEGRHYKKDSELMMVFYIMLQNSGLDFIYEHLDKIMEDKDIKKTIFTIYKKSFHELVYQIQKTLQEDEKKLQSTFKPGRVR